MIDLKQDSRGVVLPVSAQAGARRNGIVGLREGALRIAVTAAPEKGKANRAIIAVLSEILAVPKSAIELLSGETSPRKRFIVLGATVDQVVQSVRDATET
jgi:uncharacterized protein (TIGR00251 family)